MITTTIQETKAGIMNLSANAAAKPQDKKDGDSFQKVFDKQTGNGDNKAERSQANKNNTIKKKPLENAGKLRDKDLKDASADFEESEPLKETENADLIVETAEEKASELMAQIAGILDVPQERIDEVLQEQGLASTDLLREPELNSFVMELSEVKDVTALLTDGELYGKLQQVLNAGAELVKEAGNELGIEPKAFLDKLKSAQEEQGNVGITKETSLENPQESIMIVNEANSGQDAKPDPKSDHKKESSEGQGGNLVLQEMVKAQAEQTLEPVMEENPQEQRVDTEMIMRQIMDHMKIQLKPDVSSLEMQLHPASLGNLQVQLTSKGGAVTAQFFAQNETVKAALETQMIQLQESFEEQGIKVEAIEVSVQTRQFDQNLEEQGKGRQEQGAQKGRGTRRIRIDGSLTQEQLDELTAEERISAEMMQAGGGTVDFTA